MTNLQISEFFKLTGHKISEMEIGKFYPVDGWQILSYDTDSEQTTWADVSHVVRKETVTPVLVNSSNKAIRVSPEHIFYVKIGTEVDAPISWVEAIDLVEENSPVYLLSDAGTWEAAKFSADVEDCDILDLAVEKTHCYFSQGFLSHNTMYGDGDTTPGGSAIPYHASIRIKLSGGTQIKNDKKEVVGINVIARTVKNKVTMPFRSVNFQIHFGVGVREHEELFDLMRIHGPEVINGLCHIVYGEGAWKHFCVFDPTLPENSNKEDPKTCILEKAFHKDDFRAMLSDPQYKKPLEDLLEVVMTRKIQTDELSIDPESYIDMTALAAEIGDQLDGVDELTT